MSPEQLSFLNLRTFPARLNVEQAATLLGCQPHDIPILTARGFLEPLGRPKANCTRWYASRAVRRLGDDEKQLSRACQALQDRWRHKNHPGEPSAPRRAKREALTECASKRRSANRHSTPEPEDSSCPATPR